MTDHDIIVLGDGPGDYIAAERLGHTGKNVLLVEASSLGGTCLNMGYIPTRAPLGVAKTYNHTRHGAQLGVKVGGAHVDWPTLQKWKDKVVSILVGGVVAVEKKAEVAIVRDHGTFDGPGKATVDSTTHTAIHMALATGSVPVTPPIPGAKDNPLIVDSTGVLPLPETPEHLAVVGGGAIGVEFTPLYSILGMQVTVVEVLPEIVPFADDDVTARPRKTLKDVTFELGYRVTSIDGGKVNWTIADDAEESVEASYVLMTVGRRPTVDGWGTESTGPKYSGRGVVVDDRARTNLPNVRVIRNVISRSLLAHAVRRMGEMTATNILNPEAHRRGEVIRQHTALWAVYTAPKCTGIGLTEAAARKADRDIITVSIPDYMSDRFMAENDLQAPGLAKLILDTETRQVLGIRVLGSYAAEMIWSTSTVLETELDLTDLRQFVFPHPTVSELVREAAWAAKT